jgi:hypothetical protein
MSGSQALYSVIGSGVVIVRVNVACAFSLVGIGPSHQRWRPFVWNCKRLRDSIAMFVADETADELVRNQEKLQDLVHGKTAMAWLPGQSAGIGAQACLMFGAADRWLALTI